MTILQTEYITTSSGGSLDVGGDDFDAALYISGQPVAYFWSDFEGSVGQNLIRTILSDVPEAIQRFRKSVSGAVPVSTSIVNSFPELLSILADGEYQLELEELPSDAYVVDFYDWDSPPNNVTNFYPGFGAMVATQPQSALNDDVVQEYVRLIGDGVRPVVITLTAKSVWGEFVIDGHHKLRAYGRSGISIRRLSIIKLNPLPVNLANVLDLIPDSSAEKGKLRKNKPT